MCCVQCSACTSHRTFCSTTVQHKTSMSLVMHCALHTKVRWDLENFESLSRVQFLSDLDEILTQGSWLKVALENVPPHEFGLKLCPWEFFEISSNCSYIWGALRAPQILHIAKLWTRQKLGKIWHQKRAVNFFQVFLRIFRKKFFCLQLIFGPSRWV